MNKLKDETFYTYLKNRYVELNKGTERILSMEIVSIVKELTIEFAMSRVGKETYDWDWEYDKFVETYFQNYIKKVEENKKWKIEHLEKNSESFERYNNDKTISY